MTSAGSFPISSSTLDQICEPLRIVVRQIADNAIPQSASAPVLLHLLGVPGSGKSTAVSFLRTALSARNPTVLAFDQLMESVPDYRDNPDRAAAFSRWEVPARDAGYRLLRELVEKRSDIIFDHSGATPSHVELVSYARARAGYYIAIIRLRTAPGVASKRLESRYLAGGRFVPSGYIAERAAAISSLVSNYKRVAHCYAEIDNDPEGGEGIRLLAAECVRLADRISVRASA